MLLFFAAVLFSCGRDIRNREQVEAAIKQRLETHSGLDMKNLDMSTTDLSFDKNRAYATVAFHPKGDTSLNSSMAMKYTLEDQHGKWVVVHVGDGSGHSMSGHAGMDQSNLPPGHPPIGDGQQAGQSQQPNQDRNTQ